MPAEYPESGNKMSPGFFNGFCEIDSSTSPLFFLFFFLHAARVENKSFSKGLQHIRSCMQKDRLDCCRGILKYGQTRDNNSIRFGLSGSTCHLSN